MKSSLIFILLALSGKTGASQNIGIGTTSPHPSAELDVSSNNKGFLPPRMSFAERNAIVSPAAGLVLWCTDCVPKGELQVFNGSEWTNLTGGVAATNIPQIPNVTIGTQTWSLKNLDVAAYRNGDPIPQVTDPTLWSNLTTGAWCWYNNDSSIYGPTYGRLYNWYAVKDPRGLCPAGWHVPSDIEWSTMENYLGGTSVAGGALKNIIGWTGTNTGASNSSGFSALPGGFHGTIGNFNDNGSTGYFWSNTEFAPLYAIYRYLTYYSTEIFKSSGGTRGGMSVRCIKD